MKCLGDNERLGKWGKVKFYNRTLYFTPVVKRRLDHLNGLILKKYKKTPFDVLFSI
jgi:hypothetical protein